MWLCSDQWFPDSAAPSVVPSGPDADAGIVPRSLDVIFSSVGERCFSGMSLKPQRCREFARLTGEQQAEEMLFKKTLLRQMKEVRSCILRSQWAGLGSLSWFMSVNMCLCCLSL